MQRGDGCRLRGTRSRSSEFWKRGEQERHVHADRAMQPGFSHTKTHTLPFESDAKTGSGGLWLVENGCCVDSDEHLKGESQLHLPQSTGDDQRHETRGSRHVWVVPHTQRV